jgi:polyadenylate-binding protein
VLIKNIAPAVTQKELHDLFSTKGEVASCKIEQYQDGTSRGFGYVQFATAAEAEKAIAELNSKDLNGK